MKRKHFKKGLSQSVVSLAALQFGCQRNAGSTANPLKTTNQRKKGQLCQIYCQNCTVFRFSVPFTLLHTTMRMEAKTNASTLICHYTVLSAIRGTSPSLHRPIFHLYCWLLSTVFLLFQIAAYSLNSLSEIEPLLLTKCCYV